jgi:CRP/FNR family transcriptional regulator, cyclic AMP receptor protein
MSITAIRSNERDNHVLEVRPLVQPNDGRFAAVRRLWLFEGVSDHTLSKLALRTRWQTYAANEVIVDVGDATNDVFIITEGSVRVIVRTDFGYESILDDMIPNQFFGEIAAIDSTHRSANVTALTQTKLCVIPGAAFMELVLSAPDVARRLMVFLAKRLREKDDRLIEFGALTVRQRLIAELIRLSRPRANGTERVISPPPPQHVLASRVATRRETVSREMAEMIRSGTITVGRGAIVLHRPHNLTAEIEARLHGTKEATRSKG